MTDMTTQLNYALSILGLLRLININVIGFFRVLIFINFDLDKIVSLCHLFLTNTNF